MPGYGCPGPPPPSALSDNAYAAHQNQLVPLGGFSRQGDPRTQIVRLHEPTRASDTRLFEDELHALQNCHLWSFM
jgi:hypothetical protein